LRIRHERGTKELLAGLSCLLLSAGLTYFFWWVMEWTEVHLLLIPLLTFGYGLYSALGVWEVTVDTARGRVSWAAGLGVPLFRRTLLLTAFDRVQVHTVTSARGCMVQLVGGDSEPHLLSGSDDTAEAMALAEAVALHTGLSLQVGDGRVRAVGEPAAPAVAREEPPLQVPVGSRVEVREAGGQLEVRLPAPGWQGGFLSWAYAGVGLWVAPCGVIGYLLTFPLARDYLVWLVGFALVPFVAGGVFLRRALVGARTTWRITVSRPGLEVVRAGSGAPQSTRVPARLLQEVDVRELQDRAAGLGLFQEATCPLLVLEREDGPQLVLGAGLPRRELEWVAARVRQEVAKLAESRRQERSASPAPARARV
jgi:hypothetical protein